MWRILLFAVALVAAVPLQAAAETIVKAIELGRVSVTIDNNTIACDYEQVLIVDTERHWAPVCIDSENAVEVPPIGIFEISSDGESLFVRDSRDEVGACPVHEVIVLTNGDWACGLFERAYALLDEIGTLEVLLEHNDLPADERERLQLRLDAASVEFWHVSGELYPNVQNF